MTPEPIFRAVAAGMILTLGVVGGYHRVRAERLGGAVSRREEPLGVFIPIRLCGLLGALCVLAYLVRPGWVRWATLRLPEPLRWAGAGLIALGMVLFVAAVRTLGGSLTDTVATRERHALVVSGPYRFIRHPFYVAAAATLLGLSLLAALWPLAVLTAALFALWVVRMPIEERKLAERFGEAYREYARRTGRFVPRSRPAAADGTRRGP